MTSGSNPQVSLWIDELYGSIIEAKPLRQKVSDPPEAAKVIENTQRDINIALMNELSIICGKIRIKTSKVLGLRILNGIFFLLSQAY